MSREEIINTITSRLPNERLSIKRKYRFKKQPFKTAWFYTLVAINRYTPLSIPIYGTTVWRHRLKAYSTSAIGSIRFLGFYDSDITLFLLKHYHETGDMLDVGANIGIYASLFSYLAPDSARVVAFEPTPSTFAVMRDSMQQCGNVTAEQLALSDQIGEISFHDYGVRHGVFNSSEAQPRPFLDSYDSLITVPSTTLDSYCSEHKLKPSLIKLDTEGTEVKILEAGTTTLAEYKPTILLELSGEEAWAAGIHKCFDILTEQGYHFFNATREGELTPHQRRDSYLYENLIAIHGSKLAGYGITN